GLGEREQLGRPGRNLLRRKDEEVVAGSETYSAGQIGRGTGQDHGTHSNTSLSSLARRGISVTTTFVSSSLADSGSSESHTVPNSMAYTSFSASGASSAKVTRTVPPEACSS